MSDSVRPHRWQPTRLPRPWDSPGKNAGVGCHFHFQCMKVKSEREVDQSCPTPRDPMDCSLPGSSIHGIFQSKVLKLVAIAFSENYPGYHQLVKSWSQFASSFGVLASTNQHNIWYSMFNNWSGKHIPFDPHHMKEPQANLFCMWISLLPFTIYCSPQEFLSVIQTDKLQHMGQI